MTQFSTCNPTAVKQQQAKNARDQVEPGDGGELGQGRVGDLPRAGRKTYHRNDMAEWWSIEVLHGEFSAFQWQQSYDSELIEAALTNGALDGTWHAGEWGVAFEVCFSTAAEWEAFRDLPIVRAALDSVPDPVNGLLIYRGRGGTSAGGKPRRPRPAPSASAIALPEPSDEAILDLTRVMPPEPVSAVPAGSLAGHGAAARG
jgi:hypothetical protein